MYTAVYKPCTQTGRVHDCAHRRARVVYTAVYITVTRQCTRPCTLNNY